MIQMPGSHYSKQEYCRTLPYPKSSLSLNLSYDGIKKEDLQLRELAEVATNLGQLRVSSPLASPSLCSDHMFPEFAQQSNESQHRRLVRLPSCSDLIAAVERLQTGEGLPGISHHSVARRGSSSSEYSLHGHSFGSAPGLSPLSTTNTSPVVSPRTPPNLHNILPASHLQIDIQLASHQDEAERKARRLALNRSRRPSSRLSPYGTLTTQSRRGSRQNLRQSPSAASVNSPTTPDIQVDGSRQPQPQSQQQQQDARRHFNQKYKTPDKLFLIYHKEDCRWGWSAIQTRRLEFLPILLGDAYDREVEERREVAGLNGMYYRENAMMPVLTPDGSGLVFVERDGRWWECTKSQKCRTGTASSRRVAPGGAGVPGLVVDTRPRGMVERYPEEVLLYWDEHVRHFIPEEKQAEIYARASNYSEIRAEQRRQHGVPQWSIDNKDDRVLDLNRPEKEDDDATSPKAKNMRRTKRV